LLPIIRNHTGSFMKPIRSLLLISIHLRIFKKFPSWGSHSSRIKKKRSFMENHWQLYPRRWSISIKPAAPPINLLISPIPSKIGCGGLNAGLRYSGPRGSDRMTGCYFLLITAPLSGSRGPIMLAKKSVRKSFPPAA